MQTRARSRFLMRALACAAAAGLGGVAAGSALAAGPADRVAASAAGRARLAAALGLQEAPKIEAPAPQVEEKKGAEEKGKGEVKAPAAEKWQLAVTPYLWAAGMNGDVGIADRVTHVDITFRELLKHFEGGAMLFTEVRKGRVGLLTDLFYVKLEDTAPTPGPVFSNARVVISQIVADGALAYRVVQQGPLALDLYAGPRYWHLNGQLGLRRGGQVARHFEATDDWLDPIVGGRVRAQLNPKLAIFSLGDYGGFGVGADSDWQFVGGAGYKTSRHQELKAGYRILSVDRQNGGFLYNVELSGPFVAYTFGQ